MKTHALKSAAQISASPNKYCNLVTSKMGKTWYFIFCYSRHTKKNSLDTARTQKEDSNKITLIQEQ
jgi:fructose-bisphosphate aldolase class 1